MFVHFLGRDRILLTQRAIALGGDPGELQVRLGLREMLLRFGELQVEFGRVDFGRSPGRP